RLPDQNGLLLLDQLKATPKTRHIPVHVISSSDFSKSALEMGAMGYMLKPVKREEILGAMKKISEKLNQKMKKVLIVEDNEIQREHILRLIDEPMVEVDAVSDAHVALEKLANTTYDCMIMDLNLPDLSGHDLLRK